MCIRRIHSRSLLLPLLAFPLLISQPVAFGQSPIIADEVITAPVQTLSVNDVDFINSTTPRWFFTIPLSTRDGSSLQASMTIRLTAILANGENLGEVVLLETPPFTVNGIRSVTNLDLRQPEFRDGGTYVVNSAARRRLEDIALPSGLVPPGYYDFLVTVSTSAGEQAEPRFIRLVLTNPASIELLSPFDGEDDVNPYPLFQWRGDAPSWRIGVYEMLPGQSSLEEAASGIPHLSMNIELPPPVFQYPPSGFRSLEPGKRYVWFVEGISGSAGGISQGFRSELRAFTVASSSSPAIPISTLLDELERALGPEYRPLFEQIRNEALSPSGKMRLNGSPISSGELARLLNQLRANPASIVSVVLD